jgi:hypothetical protein
VWHLLEIVIVLISSVQVAFATGSYFSLLIIIITIIIWGRQVMESDIEVCNGSEEGEVQSQSVLNYDLISHYYQVLINIFESGTSEFYPTLFSRWPEGF